jgi:hypothetical protein
MILSANESDAPDRHHRRSAPPAIAKKGASYLSFDRQSVGRIDRSRFAQARPQAHYAAQRLARAAHAFRPPLPGIGHWRSNRCTAAIAVGHKIVEATGRQAEVETFLRAGTDIGMGTR